MHAFMTQQVSGPLCQNVFSGLLPKHSSSLTDQLSESGRRKISNWLKEVGLDSENMVIILSVSFLHKVS